MNMITIPVSFDSDTVFVVGLPKDNISFSDVKGKASFKDNTLTMNVYGSDPLVTPAPNIDWKITARTSFVVDKSNTYFLRVDANVEGRGFPAYESMIEDSKGTKAFLITISSPEKSNLASELLNPFYDTFKDQLLDFELDKEGSFTGNMWVGEREWSDRSQSYSPTIWSKTTINEWNQQHLNKQPAPDYVSENQSN